VTLPPRLLLLLALLLVIVLLGRRARPSNGGATLPDWVLPATVALVSAGLTAWIWGGLRAPAVIHDEVAYLLQADLLNHGTWKLPSPPVPQAFEQAAVLVTPVLTPKMPPGHALALSPGLAAGLPGMIPLLLTGLTAALLVVLVRRVSSAGVALVTVAIWLTQAGQMRWRASYMSQTTTGALWLAGWWLLLRWRETRRTPWLVALAAVAGLGAVTRPLTMLAWAIPVGIVVLGDVIRAQRWAALGAAIATGIGVLLLLPIQNGATLGNWRASPLALYTKQYLPFDRIGFGLDSTPPLLPPAPEFQRATAEFVARHREHTLQALPKIFAARARVLLRQSFGQWRAVLIPAALLALALLPAAGWFALLSALMLYLAYLLYAHEPQWSAYYYEMTPVVAFVSALGLVWLLGKLAGQQRPALAFSGAAAIAILLAGSGDLAAARVARAGEQAPFRHFAEAIRATGAPHALVFVRYDPGADPHASFVRNVVDRDSAPVITARDLGPEVNARVAAALPGRRLFLWDQHSGRLTPLAAP